MYGFLQAMFNKEFDLAPTLTNPDLDGYRVKQLCKDIPDNRATVSIMAKGCIVA